jgi:hypothetical protein
VLRIHRLFASLVLTSGMILLWLVAGEFAPGAAAPPGHLSDSPVGGSEHELPHISSPTDSAEWSDRADSFISSQHPVVRAGDASGTTVLASGSCCEPLPPPTGNIIEVCPSQARQLGSIVAGAAAGDTILLNDGV